MKSAHTIIWKNLKRAFKTGKMGKVQNFARWFFKREIFLQQEKIVPKVGHTHFSFICCLLPLSESPSISQRGGWLDKLLSLEKWLKQATIYSKYLFFLTDNWQNFVQISICHALYYLKMILHLAYINALLLSHTKMCTLVLNNIAEKYAFKGAEILKY